MSRPSFACLLLLLACSDSSAKGPMVYVALDEQLSRPLLTAFAGAGGQPIRMRFDSEAAKTVGLVSAIREERQQPLCSVFWNNELAHTVALANDGLLEPYESPAAADIPAAFRDPAHRWTGFAARARILVVNTDLLPHQEDWPTSYLDLAAPKWRGRCAVAKPLTGTTLTHFTALRHALGDAAFAAFLDRLFANDVQFLPSNGATLHAVSTGAAAWAFTDTDDYSAARRHGQHVACVFPDQQAGGIGTMLIPNSVAIVKGGPDPAGARRLVDRILAAATEAQLAAGDGAQLPLRPGVQGPTDPAIKAVGAFRAMAWDVEWTAQNLARCSQDLAARFGL